MTINNKTDLDHHSNEDLIELVRSCQAEVEKLNYLLNESSYRLNESIKNLRMLLANLPGGIVITDRNHCIQAINSQSEELFGYERAELINRKVDVLFPDTNFLEPRIGANRIMGRRNGGNLFPCEIYVNTVDTLDGNSCFFLNVQDITERERLNNLKQEFIAMVSHDLRSPLFSIHGIVTLAEEGVYGQLNEAGQHAMKRAQDSADYLLGLVNNLLDMDKLESGTFVLRRESISITLLIERAVSAVDNLVAQKQLQIDTEIVDCQLNADFDRLLQVLINLLSNAIKYSPEGGRIIISVQEDREMVRFQVTDQGPGIPDHMRKEVFDRFKQLEHGTKRGGFGLGLSIAKRIVDFHGGRVWVEGNPGAGSTFVFSVPASIDE